MGFTVTYTQQPGYLHAEGDLMKFAEDVAINRFLRVAVFSSVPDAELWLQHMPGGRGRN